MDIATVRQRHITNTTRTHYFYFALGWLLTAMGMLGAYFAMVLTGQSWMSELATRVAQMVSAIL